MKNTNLICCVVGLACFAFLGACSDDTPANNGSANNGTTTNNGTTPTNNGTTPTNNGTTPSTDPEPTCDNYCALLATTCTGDNAQYGSEAECLDYCNVVGAWEAGTQGATSGNSIACRIYHGNNPAAMQPDTHCDHAGPTGEDTCGTWCENYCSLAATNCTGDNALYPSDSDCLTACEDFNDSGEAGDTQFDTVQCRIYHLGAPAAGNPETHCPHGGEVPTAMCVLLPEEFIFRTDAPTAYTRVDRMGMPAINTAVITSKDDYNEANPVDDVAGTFVTEITNSVTALHAALDDDLTGAGLTPCAVNDCIAQAAPLVIPDTLKIDTSSPSGFPNGRRLPDPVMDVTLAVVLLDLTTHDVTTLVGLPLNPTQNDLGVEGAFLNTFPYLHAPHNP